MNKKKWDRTCMELAYLVSEHSTCLRRKVGAVIAKDNRIIATGFNGSPEGIDHCTTCMRDELKVPSGQRHELSMAVHAEMNAIIQCALHGVSPEGATIYITVTPCSMCLKSLINARIKRIVIDKDIYPDDLTRKLLEQSNIELDVLTSGCDIIPNYDTPVSNEYILGLKKFEVTYPSIKSHKNDRHDTAGTTLSPLVLERIYGRAKSLHEPGYYFYTNGPISSNTPDQYKSNDSSENKAK